MSALPPKADIRSIAADVSFVPNPDTHSLHSILLLPKAMLSTFKSDPRGPMRSWGENFGLVPRAPQRLCLHLPVGQITRPIDQQNWPPHRNGSCLQCRSTPFDWRSYLSAFIGWRASLHLRKSAPALKRRQMTSPQRHRRSTAPVTRISPTSTGSIRTCACRVAVYVASIRSAGHAPSGVETNAKLTLLPDHSVGADRKRNTSFRLLPG